VYRDCKSDDDLFCNKTLNAYFFAQIASLTSWFNQCILFSLSPVTFNRFCLQHSTAEATMCLCVLPGSFRGMGAFYFKLENRRDTAMIADLHNDYSFSMSSDSSEIPRTLLSYWMQIACSLLFPPMPSISSYKSQLTYEISCSAQVSKPARSRLPDGDQLKILHLISLERTAPLKTSLPTRRINLSLIFAPYLV